MLGKLLKYELKATARWFFPMYIALIVLTLLNKLTMVVELPDIAIFTILKGLLIGTYILIIIFTTIATFILLLVRFYKNLYTDEGYLTHTLPVKPSVQLNCKILSGVIWVASSVLIQIISLVILAAGEGILSELGKMLGELKEYLEVTGLTGDAVASLIIFGVVMLISAFYSLLMMYCSLSLGSLFRQFKIVGAILVYFVISFVVELFGMVIMLVCMSSAWMDSMIYEIETVENITVEFFKMMNGMMIGSGILSLILTVVFYFLSHLVIAKKLNLD